MNYVLDREIVGVPAPVGSISVKVVTEEEIEETESSGSSEEIETPRSVGRWDVGAAAKAKERVHSQVLRIREEESCLLGEDKAAKFGCDREEYRRCRPRHRLNTVLVSKPNLPCSPLSGKVGAFKTLQ